MIAILDYGIGNVFSIYNMLRKIGVAAEVANDPYKVESASKIILPGVGHFSYCMQQLKAAPFFSILQEKVIGGGIPVLGVCVGCQMLMEKSEEGNEEGLGWIKGQVVRFDEKKMESAHKIPHMGWSDVYPESGVKLFWKIDAPRFYFVHSYHVMAQDRATVIASANYGYSFTAAVAQKNIMGVQFHPEKSHKFGMKLYENFAKHY
jgi:glutamine amidotransferase